MEVTTKSGNQAVARELAAFQQVFVWSSTTLRVLHFFLQLLNEAINQPAAIAEFEPVSKLFAEGKPQAPTPPSSVLQHHQVSSSEQPALLTLKSR